MAERRDEIIKAEALAKYKQDYSPRVDECIGWDYGYIAGQRAERERVAREFVNLCNSLTTPVTPEEFIEKMRVFLEKLEKDGEHDGK